ncbi:YaaR family protein [Paraclostridium bifermentans]|uniref:YaaR family protein n=1 Tax=Paraclostridium bifermentans TaxID=1490 RepID=UPI00359CAB00
MKIRDFNIISGSNSIDTKVKKAVNSFDDNFKKINILKSKEEIENYIKQIKDIGRDLVITKGYNEVLKYKQVIQKYLKSVVDYTYEIDKKDSFWNNNYFKTVNVVNEKLDSITRKFFEEEKENIDIASQVDEINGLLIDLYL